MRHDWVEVPAAPILGLPRRYKCRVCWLESASLDSLTGIRGFAPPCRGHTDRECTDRKWRDPIGLQPRDILPAVSPQHLTKVPS